MEDEYELMPRTSVTQIKEELETLKKKAAEGDISMNKAELKDSMEKLSSSINLLIELFKTATEEIKTEDQEQKIISTKLGPLTDKLDQVIEQNEQIAKGLVAIADLIRENIIEKPKIPEPFKPEPMFRQPFPAPKPSDDLFGPGMEPPMRPNMPPAPEQFKNLESPFSPPPRMGGMPSLGPSPFGQGSLGPPLAPPMPGKKKGIFGFMKK